MAVTLKSNAGELSLMAQEIGAQVTPQPPPSFRVS